MCVPLLFIIFGHMHKNFYDCPIEATMEIIGGKWNAIILYYLLEKPRRYSEIMELLETCSSRMLSKQLRELESLGIISRSVFASAPPKVEYAVTAYGQTLAPVIQLICDWGEKRLTITGRKAVYN